MTCLRSRRSTICGSRPSGDEPGDRIREGNPRGDERHGADRLHDDDRTGWPAGGGCPCGGAERVGFDFSVTTDHYFPWLESQGHVSYEWSVLGAAAQATQRIPLMTYVTCPTTRYHPVDVAQKAATMQLLSQGRFRLGLGSGGTSTSMWWAAVGPLRTSGWRCPRRRWRSSARPSRGENVNHHGARFDVENARLRDLPDAPADRCRRLG
ncbi:LLM class flavin-dependent oxidoreductase [Streptomyces mirabilis]|uniref:LLM class flavin-dependent oxidoreductase n=1 Tax=Streptomyces mirabilis TaxID=68239 RepID=UPI0036BF09CF